MANSFNSGNEYRTKISKGLIPAHTMVTINSVISYDKKTAHYKDKSGNIAEYSLDELTPFGISKYTKGTFDIVNDYNKSIDTYGNKDVVHVNMHLTKNVRSSMKIIFWDDCLYSSVLGNGYDYTIRDLTDQEVIDILLEEIIYGIRPDLDCSSLVGSSSKGIDMDPNYHDGNYLLPNNKDYTVTWCCGEIIIREGVDNGWYPGKSNIGREIFHGNMDWEKYRQAKIKMSVLKILSDEKKILLEFPEVLSFITEKIKNSDEFKLNYEL